MNFFKAPHIFGSRCNFGRSIGKRCSTTRANNLPPSDTSAATIRSLSSLRAEEYEEEPGNEIPAVLSYVSGIEMPITSTLHITTPKEDIPSGTWPVFRLMDETGSLHKSKCDEKNLNERTGSPIKPIRNDDTTNASMDMMRKSLSDQYPHHERFITQSDLFRPSTKPYFDVPDSRNLLLRCHRIMMRLREMDDILLNAQRQGRLSFYLTCRGEEAMTIGGASALHDSDVILTQYREQGLFMWRGFTLDQFANQCVGNDLDLGKARQMPIHYGSRALNIHTVSSPLGTQIPQAVGVAYKKKLEFISGKSDESGVSAVYFGDGAASTGDFYSACTFAATLKVPVLFFCRNNGYAISTSVREQYAGDGVVCRAKGFGMAAIRVDGNDLFAVHEATKAAREYAVNNLEPVLIEAISYRQAHHSTSDDSFSYRPEEEVIHAQSENDPINRLNTFLLDQGIMSEDKLKSISQIERASVLEALQKAEARPPAKLDTMFKDILYETPSILYDQERCLLDHMKKYPGNY